MSADNQPKKHPKVLSGLDLHTSCGDNPIIPDNQADWLTALMDLVFAKIPEHHLKPKFRADVERSITTKIAKERINELKALLPQMTPDEYGFWVRTKIVDRIADLETLKENK